MQIIKMQIILVRTYSILQDFLYRMRKRITNIMRIELKSKLVVEV